MSSEDPIIRVERECEVVQGGAGKPGNLVTRCMMIEIRKSEQRPTDKAIKENVKGKTN